MDENKFNFDRLQASKTTLKAKRQELIGTFFKFSLKKKKKDCS